MGVLLLLFERNISLSFPCLLTMYNIYIPQVHTAYIKSNSIHIESSIFGSLCSCHFLEKHLVLTTLFAVPWPQLCIYLSQYSRNAIEKVFLGHPRN